MGRTGSLAAAVLAAAALAGCGSTAGQADVRPLQGSGGGGSSSSPTQSSPSASATPGARATRVARSDLEGQAPVRAARAWAAAVAQEVNSKSSTHAQTRPLTTARGERTLTTYYTSDYGLTYPGPLPFTPLSVATAGRTARVPACLLGKGWGINGTGLSPQPKTLNAVTFVLRRSSGSWKLDKINARRDSCANVSVKGYAS